MADLEQVKRLLAEKIIEDGGYFRKCANCGDVYPLPQADWTDETVCGERCFAAFAAHLNNPHA